MKTEIISLGFQIFIKPADILFKTVLDKRGCMFPAKFNLFYSNFLIFFMWITI